MADEFKYKLIDNKYQFFAGDQPLGDRLTEVAFAYSKTTGSHFKHGDPKIVADYVATSRKAYIDAGLSDMANDIEMISGRFELHTLDLMVNSTGYIHMVLKRLANNELSSIPFEQNTVDEPVKESRKPRKVF